MEQNTQKAILAGVNEIIEIRTEIHNELLASHERLRVAAEAMVNMYVELVDSGDAGFWDAEEVDEVVLTREALAQIPKGE